MACASGFSHTITLSDDGVHSFGCTTEGQLGEDFLKSITGDNFNIPDSRHIPTLTEIKQVACGANFTVCVDREGFVVFW